MNQEKKIDLTAEDKQLTPMMRQYMQIKNQNPDALILYRMGDFYEMFNDDAKVAARVLGLTLTSRNHGGMDKTPLAGFPYHALDRYANKLVHAGHKIAICEQVEDPKLAKGIVKRDVIELITAGTATEDCFIDERSNNYIVSLFFQSSLCGFSICDLSTGEFLVEQIPETKIEEELLRIGPSEILIPDSEDPWYETIPEKLPRTLISKYDSWKYSFEQARTTLLEHFSLVSLQGLGLETYNQGISASGALLSYLKLQKRNELKHIQRLKPTNLSQFAELDPASIRNLELLHPLHSQDAGGTLLSVLDKTSTSMGARLLKQWIVHPLKEIEAIHERLDCVEQLKKDLFVLSELEHTLRGIADIERLIAKVTFERANGRDLVALKSSLALFPCLVKILTPLSGKLIQQIQEQLQGFEGIVSTISKTLVDSPPLSVREGGLIRTGVSEELDELNNAAINGKQWIAELQLHERQRSGIQNLKVNYNKVFGYFIEVSHANRDAVPDDYIRKQTLSTVERFITPQLKEMETKILGAQERIGGLEYELFSELRAQIADQCQLIQKAAVACSQLDVLIALGRVAFENRYCRPTLTNNQDMLILDGRHPVVEQMIEEQFVENDTELITDSSQILLITGPNMAGKSTYLRQNALIALMAQIGSFVPASKADIGIVDKFFTRVGASDRLAQGQSTFLVEMIEVANILNNATVRSLVLLDEVGRGTSTFDGISIAWAVAEYIHESETCRPRTLFATHYHELTELVKQYSRMRNLHVKIREWNEKMIFIRKIDKGSCDHSYGIGVARLAGVPKQVISRAQEILVTLENTNATPVLRSNPYKNQKSSQKKSQPIDGIQLNFMDNLRLDILAHLRSISIETLTPLQALTLLSELKQKAIANQL